MTFLINPHIFSGSGGGVDDPSTIAGLTLWLDASDLTLTGGDPVTSWPDKSSNGYDATDTTGINRSAYRSAGVGGQPSVYFNSGYDGGLALSISEPVGDWTWFFVISPDGTGQGYLYDAETGRLLFDKNDSGTKGPGWFDGSWKSGGTPKAGAQVFEYNLASGAGTLYVDKVSTVTGSYTQRALGGAQRIAARFNGDPAYYRGHIAEIIVYNSALGSTDRNTIYTYLNDKYGFTL